MSSLAKLMLCKGKRVSGSDAEFGTQMEALTECGATVTVGCDIGNMAGVELVVYSSAIKADNAELQYAKLNGIATVERHLFLSEVCEDFDTVIAIAGTHGKTTTTAMMASMFMDCGQPFTAHIGGNLESYGNMIYRGEKFFITEACEYKRNLLALKPDIAVVLNVEYDHPDTYKNLQEVMDTFFDFCSGIKSGGSVVVCQEDGLTPTPKNAISYGLEGGYAVTHIRHNTNGCYACDICYSGKMEAHLELSICGLHNLYNATACYIVAKLCGLDCKLAVESINNFGGVARRFECKGKVNGARVIIDYAHHPTEIACAISTAKVQCEGKLHVVFQPHTYSRTSCLFEEFCGCFDKADTLLLFKEYASREFPACGVDCYTLYKAISSTNSHALYYNNLLQLASKIVSIAKADDIILICGAGDIDVLAQLLPIT